MVSFESVMLAFLFLILFWRTSRFIPVPGFQIRILVTNFLALFCKAFISTKARRRIKGSKDADFRLVF